VFASERKSKMNVKRITMTMTLGLALALMAPVAQAAHEVYRWVDKAGVVHYGDHPPEGVEATLVGVKPNTVQSVNPEPASRKATGEEATDAETGEPELSYAEQSRQERAEKRRQAQEEARRLEAECAVMQRQKDWVEPSPRVIVEDEEGNPRRLDDDERLKLLEEAKAFLEENCR
jgi:hypothetical protein